ncbi:MAG TPA: tRNA uridine-5-carboxymethylaminomethyl(34) synthesis GTPase MnmE [Polyangia bacterium]|jgi:tRNA modification GTPase|nr:tRNA uridine-5-carboxymethylaminomethyl(34) synthesis GTPase MnmE [Polyangia bacterium]
MSAATDTIVAIATATGGGIGIVRVSGPAAGGIARRLLRPWPEVPESHRLYHGWVHHPGTGEVLDEVLGCLMVGPRSYTGEDVLELHGHGGAASLARLLDAVVQSGARMAEPGEFTRRAFLGGRMDLTRAEAVAELIAARSERAVRLAQGHLRGALAERVESLAERLLDILAEVEAEIDFPEEGLEVGEARALATKVRALAGEVGGLAASYVRGRALMEGVDVVLVGRPNAGKSSLLNALVGEERALVDEAPGTTRDFIEAEVSLGGVRMRLVDTAGEREAEGQVEARGMFLGRRRRARADLVLLLVDGTVGWGELEERIRSETSGPTLLVWNKCDAAPPPSRGLGTRAEGFVALSARTGDGLEQLRQALRDRVDPGNEEDAGATVISARQQEAFKMAEEALLRAAAVLAQGAPSELAAVDLRIGLERLRQVTGASVQSDVLDRVFARFCIGK